MFSCVWDRRIGFVLVVVGVLVFGIGGVVLGGVIRVPGDVGTIQGAIDMAVDGDEIVVDAGTYNEAINLSGKAVLLHSSGGRDVTVIDGTGLDSSVVTIVNGEGLDTVIEGFTITGGTGTVFFSSSFGGGMYLVSSSPTISDCLIEGNVIPDSYFGEGGGIYIESGSPHILNCEFRQNRLEQANNGSGGGVCNTNQGLPTIEDCIFVDNFAKHGGGIFSHAQSAGIISRCSFINNNATSGGGIDDAGSGSTITDCSFSGNTAISGGGIAGGWDQTGDHESHIERCTFASNTASFYGGGLWISGAGDFLARVIVNDCIFTNNIAERDEGGGVYIDNFNTIPGNGLASIADCSFTNNHAGGDGGGCSMIRSYAEFARCDFADNTADEDGGGFYEAGSKELTVSDSLFSGNSSGRDGGGLRIGSHGDYFNLIVRNNNAARNGGGVYISIASLLSDFLVSNNTATGDGGGIYIGSSALSLTMSNFTVADNVSTAGRGDGITVIGSTTTVPLRNSIVRNGSDGIWINPQAQFITANDDIEGGGFAGDGVIDADPMFVDRLGGDYRLRSGSPCIDSGANAFILFGSVIDLDGNARRVDDPFVTDTGQGKSPVVDMGAYEFQALVGPTLVVSPDPIIAGEKVVFTLLNGRGDSEAFLLYSLRGTGRVFVPSLNVVVDLDHPLRVRGSQFTDEKGRARYVTRISENAKGIDIWFQGVEENVKTGVVATSVE